MKAEVTAVRTYRSKAYRMKDTILAELQAGKRIYHIAADLHVSAKLVYKVRDLYLNQEAEK